MSTSRSSPSAQSSPRFNGKMNSRSNTHVVKLNIDQLCNSSHPIPQHHRHIVCRHSRRATRFRRECLPSRLSRRCQPCWSDNRRQTLRSLPEICPCQSYLDFKAATRNFTQSWWRRNSESRRNGLCTALPPRPRATSTQRYRIAQEQESPRLWWYLTMRCPRHQVPDRSRLHRH